MTRKKSASKTATKPAKGFSADERAAMRERARELKAEAEGVVDEKSVLAKIDEMAAPDRAMAKRLHAIIKTAAPDLAPKLWYGMPAYAKDGKVLCFFQAGEKFKTRYSTLGFSDKAALDDGEMWPTSFALSALTAGVEARIIALIRKAAG
jgi:uncharacterized protein YdhG (YjbR/CyaY superfamily)